MATPRLIKIRFKERLYRRRYLVPNLVTLGNMFCGFLTTIYAASGRYEKASLAIALAILLDGVDGRVARRLNATSKFGVEFDSFSDLVSFGVAPALLMYHWCFKAVADEFGVFICFIFALCAASRLARFNIAAENLDRFEGLPTPGAAAMVAALINFAPVITQSIGMTAVGTTLMLILSGLMVSKAEFMSIKRIKIKRMNFLLRVLFGAAIALVWYNNQIGFLAIAASYCLSGPVISVYGKYFRKKRPNVPREDSAMGAGI